MKKRHLALLASLFMFQQGCDLDYVVTNFQKPVTTDNVASQESVTINAPKKEKKPWREYGVFATDDAPVNGPELADTYFSGERLADCPYKPYSATNRIRGDKFNIGQLPDQILETGPTNDLVKILKDAAGNTEFGSEKDLRVAIVFTGEKFASQAEEGLKYLRAGTATLDGKVFETYRTKTGLFYQAKDFGILVCGHETFFTH